MHIFYFMNCNNKLYLSQELVTFKDYSQLLKNNLNKKLYNDRVSSTFVLIILTFYKLNISIKI